MFILLFRSLCRNIQLKEPLFRQTSELMLVCIGVSLASENLSFLALMRCSTVVLLNLPRSKLLILHSEASQLYKLRMVLIRWSLYQNCYSHHDCITKIYSVKAAKIADGFGSTLHCFVHQLSKGSDESHYGESKQHVLCQIPDHCCVLCCVSQAIMSLYLFSNFQVTLPC